MLDNLLIALKVSGIGIVVLLLALTVFAGLVSLMTRFLKDRPEEEESGEVEEAEIAESETIPAESELGRIAAIAVAIARAQSAFVTSSNPSSSALSSWGQFHLNRRLNSSVPTRRTK